MISFEGLIVQPIAHSTVTRGVGVLSSLKLPYSMFVFTDLLDVVYDFLVHKNLDLCEVVNICTIIPGWLFLGYNIVRNSTMFKVYLKVHIPKSNA